MIDFTKLTGPVCEDCAMTFFVKEPTLVFTPVPRLHKASVDYGCGNPDDDHGPAYEEDVMWVPIRRPGQVVVVAE